MAQNRGKVDATDRPRNLSRSKRCEQIWNIMVSTMLDTTQSRLRGERKFEILLPF